MLEPTDGQPGLYRDADTGRYYNIKDFSPFEYVVPFPRSNMLELSIPKNEFWMLRHWSVVLHPWPEVIDPEIRFRLEINGMPVARDVPLFRLAEPLARKEDEKSNLEKRIEILETAFRLKQPLPQPLGVLRQDLSGGTTIVVLCDKLGYADTLGTLREMTKHFLVTFRGERIVQVVR